MRWICDLFTPNPDVMRKQLLRESELELIRAQAALDAADARVIQLEATTNRLKREIEGMGNGSN